jgi:MYXO-CTERM domain-containing protein
VLGGTVAALGWLPDGRLWAAELTGTLLVQGEGVTPSSWSEVLDARRVTGDLMPLERAPWDDESAPQASDRGPAQPRPPGPVPPHGQGPQAPSDPSPAEGAPPPAAAPEGRGCGCSPSGAGPWLLAWLLPAWALPRRRR